MAYFSKESEGILGKLRIKPKTALKGLLLSGA
jgi:hypothetical protein